MDVVSLCLREVLSTMWVRLCAVAFTEGVLLHSSSHPFKLDIVTFMIQVGRLGLSKRRVLRAEARAGTTMYLSPFLQCSKQVTYLAYLPRLPIQKFSLGSELCWDFTFCYCSCFIGWRDQDRHHPFFKWSTLFINGLVHHMLKTAQVLSRRPCHMALISVCFVCWLVLRQCQALDPALPMWDDRRTGPYSVW